MAKEGENMLTVSEVSEQVRVHQETVRRWIKNEGLPAIKFGNRGGWHIRERDLRIFLERKRRESLAVKEQAAA